MIVVTSYFNDLLTLLADHDPGPAAFSAPPICIDLVTSIHVVCVAVHKQNIVTAFIF